MFTIVKKNSFLKINNINLLINYFVVAYAFIMPLSRAAVSALSIALIILWFFDGHLKRKLDLMNKTYMAAFVLVFFMLISYLWSENYAYANSFMRKYIQYFFVSFVIFTSIKKEFVKKAVDAFISGMFVSELLSFLIFFGILHKQGSSAHDPVVFMNHIEYSIYLAVLSVILIDRILSNKTDIKNRLIFVMLFFVTSTVMFITQGRTGQFIYLIDIFLIPVVYFGKNLRNIAVGFVIGLSVFVISYNLSTGFRHKFDNTVESILNIEQANPCTSVGTRINMAVVGLKIFISHPVLGVGLGDAVDVFRDYVKKKYPAFRCSLKYNQLHNQYTQTMVQLGAFGLFVFLSIFYLAYKESLDKKFSTLAVVSIMLAFMGDTLFARQFSFALITFLLSIILLKKEDKLAQ